MNHHTVAIVGAGPGGLMLARLLQMKGVSVVVYERDSSVASRNQGATLDLHYDSGLKAIESAGLMAAFRQSYRPGADRTTMVDQHGTVFLEDLGGGSGPERPEIDRGPLRDLLLESLQPGTVVWDMQFSTLNRHAEGVRLHFANGKIATADIVVAADGANSKVRRHLTDINPIYSGITIVEGSVSDAAVKVPDNSKSTRQGQDLCPRGAKKPFHRRQRRWQSKFLYGT